MRKHLLKIYLHFLSAVLFSITFTSCYYGLNKETTEIGTLNTTCLADNAWDSLCEIYSVQNIKDTIFSSHLNEIKNHFINPNYILYFDTNAKEIIGCDYYSVRVVYNPNIADYSVSGLDSILSDEEQMRIRNRIQGLLIKYQCKAGQKEAINLIQERINGNIE